MSIRIVLANPGVIYPGNTIRGKVLCDFPYKESLRGIYCKLTGKEHTSWTETYSSYQSQTKQTITRTVEYTGDNKFLQANLSLTNRGYLEAGHHEFSFSFLLPKGIPNPYDGNYGYIKYYLKVTVDKAFASDIEHLQALKIVSPINFNEIQRTLPLAPVALQDEKILCCFCCASDPITMDLVMEKESFVVGEAAKMKIDITNMSNTSITQLRIYIKMTIESKTVSPDNHYKYDKEIVASQSDTGVGAHGKRVYNIDFQIPRNSRVPNFMGSSLFRMWCVLKVEAVVPGCHSNLIIKTPVVLGHIPFQLPVPVSTTSQVPMRDFSEELPPPSYIDVLRSNLSTPSAPLK